MNRFLDCLRAICLLAAPLLTLASAPGPTAADEMAVRRVAVSGTPLALPHDLVLTPDGRYLVAADMGQDRVLLLDPATLALRNIIGQGEMSFPHDVAFDPQGRLLVADSGNDRILVYALHGPNAELVETWTGLRGPEGVAAAPNGRAYVSLVGENRVARLNGGKIEAAVDSALGAALNRPHDVEVVVDDLGFTVVVSDPGNHRLLVFDGDLQPLYEISTWNPPFSEPKYISIDMDGTIFVADQYNNRVRVFSAASQPLGELALGDAKLPEGVFARNGRVWVSDTEGGRILLYQVEENR